jgi:hypothetical protein
LPPLSPSAPVRSQGIPPGRPHGRWRAAAYGPRVEGPDSADTPTNGGSRGVAPPRNLKFQVWPAANHPQTPAVPGTKRPPGFGHRSACVPSRQWRSGPTYQPPPTASGRTPRGTPNSNGRVAGRQTRRADCTNRTAAVGDDPRDWDGDRTRRNPTIPDPER